MKKLLIALAILMAGYTVTAQDVFDNSTLPMNEMTEGDNLIDASFMTEMSGTSFFALSDEERAEKIDYFLMQNRKYLPRKKMAFIRETLMGLNEAKLKNILMTAEDEFKDPTTALVLSLFLGNLGIDRFYIGDTGAGIGKLLTMGGLGIWTIIDWFTIQSRTKDKNYKALMNLCQVYTF